ncbi:hypothetical protein [Listeria fleischmannii]|uniref:Uncharacterized protein n=1 Tax=Listeria fleischmannii FSL S10-1203 TaxID=1265822 RepID=W7DGQ2_9LIST|nr:hypothetical protein [Listeria fleischmannii]EUJ60349.1 hypothetical protein MCOL2_05048 [Listeria fleischmannii FSL S10-1203]
MGVSFHLSFITQIDDALIPLLQGEVTDSKTLFFTILTQLGGTIAMILFSLITVIIVWRKLGVRLAIWAGATFFYWRTFDSSNFQTYYFTAAAR